jgi:hypothetical protein
MKFRNLSFRYLTLALALLLAAGLMISCAGDKSAQTTLPADTTAPITEAAQTEPPVEYFKLTEQVVVVRPEGELSDDMKTAIKMITSAGKSLVDGGVTVTEDWYRDEMVRAEFEILLGKTNRPESQACADTLGYYDYTYEVISPGVVVICGGSDSATLSALQKFLGDCYGYRAGKVGENKDIPVGTTYTFRQQSDLSLSLCGQPIDSYVIVHKDAKLHRAAAEELRTNLSKKSGCLLPLVTSDSYQGGNAILLGMSDTDGSHLRRDYGSYSMSLHYEQKADGIRVIADSTASINMLARAVADTMLTGVPNKGSYDITLSDEPRIYATTTDAMYGLSLVSVTEPETVTDGLIYTKRSYKDRDGKPVIAYVLEADLSKVSLLNATPNYGNVISNVSATTVDAMKSVAAAGYDVVAGVNADFFRINGDYSPQGLCIKQGTVLSGAEGRPWFGITKDGQAVMGDAATYSKYAGKLQEAVGASTVLLKDGLVENVGYLSDSKTDRHPRTLVGTRPDGTVLIIAIDGRQAALSNGASWSDMAWILLELGAVDAVNLDGGGSTTFVTCPSAGKYTVRNSPSDGSLRRVYNSLVVVKK